ncbi:MAG: DotA/TraY family protein [Bdellovibrionales bacterium]
MLFFGNKKKKQDENGVTTGKVLNFMFNPFGSGFSPLGETLSYFSRILAYIFATYGLFPADHPVFKGGGRETVPTVGMVMATAWSRLKFTRDNIPQIFLFLGIVAGMAAAVIAFFFSIASVMLGSANAAVPTQNYYSPVDSANDLSLGWIGFLFKGKEIPNYLDQFGQTVPQSCIIQSALIVALGFYSNAILVVAAVILFYHLASMVVETAHHGQVMGKQANQIWAPIRLVVAIGLLVPIATYKAPQCPGFSASASAGLNSGQYIVIKIAEWGSNLASQVWKRFVLQLANDVSTANSGTPPMAQKAVYDTVMRIACVEAYTMYTQGSGSSGDDKDTCATPPVQKSLNPLKDAIIEKNIPDQPKDAVFKVYDFGNAKLANDGVCGSYSFAPTKPTNNAEMEGKVESAKNVARKAAYAALEQDATALVKNNLKYFIKSCVGGQDQDYIQKVDKNQLTDISLKYSTKLMDEFSKGTKDFGEILKQIAEVSGSQGWVSAGAWFNTVARAQGAIMEVSGLLPATKAPNFSLSGDPIMIANVHPALQAFEKWLAAGPPIPSSSGKTIEEQAILAAGEIQYKAGGIRETSENTLDLILGVIDVIASYNKVWMSAMGESPTESEIRTYGGKEYGGPGSKAFTLGVQFTDVNPMAEVARLGHANIETAYTIFDAYYNTNEVLGVAQTIYGAEGGLESSIGQGIGKLGAGWKSALASGAINLEGSLKTLFSNLSGQARQAISGVVGIICTVFLTAGVTLAYLLPMTPFFYFIFGVITWLVSLLEAIVCAPLVALAHLTPQGEGLPGAKAVGAYYFLFNIFLRPVLMVFALALGFLIFYLAASILNLFYIQAIVGAGGIAYGHAMFGRLVYSILYCTVIYMAANSAFRIIDWLPGHAMKWMGGQSMQFQNMGDPSQLTSSVGMVTGYVSKEIMGAVGHLNGPAAAALKSYLKDDNKHVLQGMDKWVDGSRKLGDATTDAIGKPLVNAASKAFDNENVDSGVTKIRSAGEFVKQAEDIMAHEGTGPNGWSRERKAAAVALLYSKEFGKDKAQAAMRVLGFTEEETNKALPKDQTQTPQAADESKPLPSPTAPESPQAADESKLLPPLTAPASPTPAETPPPLAASSPASPPADESKPLPPLTAPASPPPADESKPLPSPTQPKPKSS